MIQILRAAALVLGGLASLLATMAMAEMKPVLGWGRLFTNDFLGDGEDRWRTGSYTVSQVRGYSWGGTLPEFGEILEFRLRGEIIAADNLENPAPDDRRYAGILAFGLHTHFSAGGAEASLGVDLVVTGPQSGVASFQKAAHDLLGTSEPGGLDNQIGDGVYPTLIAELGKSYALSDRTILRPFIEARAGDETLVRIGGDLMIGGFAPGSLLLRDGVTGTRYRAVRGPGGESGSAFSFMLGGDVAHVADSVYLPDEDALELKDMRSRLRAGVHWQGERAEVFYGLTWLSKEFETQDESQTTGSVNVRFKF